MSIPAAAPRVDKRALRDRVYDLVLDELLRGEIAPGERLSIDELARRLDVSPTPVREALVQLERTGLVTREALKGYRVAPPLGRQQMLELFDARLVLETGAVDLAAAASRPELVASMKEAQERHEEVAERLASTDEVSVALYHEYFDADWGFHRAILEHTGNRFLLEMSESLGTHLHRMRQSVTRGAHDVDDAVREHRAVLAAFESGDADAARKAMRAHIEAVRTRSLGDL